MFTYVELKLIAMNYLYEKLHEKLPSAEIEDYESNAESFLDEILCNGEDVPGVPNATRFWIPSWCDDFYKGSRSIIAHYMTESDGEVAIAGYEFD